MKRALVVVFLLAVAAVIWFRRPSPATIGPATTKTWGAATTAPVAPPAAKATTEPKLLEGLIDAYTKPDDTAARLERSFAAATTARDKMRLLGQARDHHIPREEALRFLRAHLDDPEPAVRVYAATLLLEFGSSEGVPALLAVMKSAVDPTSNTLIDAVTAATALNRYRQVIPADLLAELYDRRRHPGLLSIMAMQGDPRYTPFLLEAAKEAPIAGHIQALGLLRSPDATDYVRQVFATTNNPRSKVAAAWSLYRLSGDSAALDYVVDAAARAPKPAGSSLDAEKSADAFRDLAVTADPAVRDFLRQNVETSATDINCRALASLYYIQHDYAFVDDYLQRFLTNPPGTQDIDNNMVWAMLFSRNDPELLALAQKEKPGAFAYQKRLHEGKPPESWVWGYLSNIPRR